MSTEKHPDTPNNFAINQLVRLDKLNTNELIDLLRGIRAELDKTFPELKERSVTEIYEEKFYKPPYLGALEGLEALEALKIHFGSPEEKREALKRIKEREQREKINHYFRLWSKVTAHIVRKITSSAFVKSEIEAFTEYEELDDLSQILKPTRVLEMEDFLLDIDEVEEMIEILKEMTFICSEIFEIQKFLLELEKKSFPTIRKRLDGIKYETDFLNETWGIVLKLKTKILSKKRRLDSFNSKLEAYRSFIGGKKYFILVGYRNSPYNILSEYSKTISQVCYRLAGELDAASKHIQEATRYSERKDRSQLIFVDDIESFSKVRKVSKAKVESFVPLDLYEYDVKKIFANIIGEPFVPKDWPGERSDLFTTRVLFNEKRVPAAFVFKGKGTTGMLTISKLGTRGDQILRLFTEPCNIFIIQYNGHVDSQVLNAMKAQAFIKSKMGEKIYFGVIDGLDTARIIKAYRPDFLK